MVGCLPGSVPWNVQGKGLPFEVGNLSRTRYGVWDLLRSTSFLKPPEEGMMEGFNSLRFHFFGMSNWRGVRSAC